MGKARDPNLYADEGTIAHKLAAMCLAEGKPPSAYIGRVIRDSDYEHAGLSPSGAYRWMTCPGSHALEGIVRGKFKPRTFSRQVSDEMAEGVQTYLDQLAKYTTARGIQPLVEHRVPLEKITGEEGAFGTVDAGVLDEPALEISAHDLKYGAGVEVSAEESEQLALYLCGMLEKFGEFYDWQRFVGVIHQPRIKDEPEEYEWSRAELLAFRDRAAAAAQTARDIKAQGWTPIELHAKALLVPGEKQCQFCAAKHDCPALKEQGIRPMAGDDVVVAEFVAKVPKAQDLQPIPADMERLANLYRMIPLARMFFDAVEGEMEARMLNGEKHPDWKVVAGRRGNRAWIDPAGAEAALKAMRIKHDEMYDYSVISPTSAEKLVKSGVIGKTQWKKLQELITQAEGRPTVVPASSDKPALEVTEIKQDFKALAAPKDIV